MRLIRIGSGAGYTGDRIELVFEFVEKCGIRYPVFECPAERTIALAQQARREGPVNYPPLEKYITA